MVNPSFTLAWANIERVEGGFGEEGGGGGQGIKGGFHLSQCDMCNDHKKL